MQFQTAAKRPPHLAACVPIVAHASETYEVYFRGGVYFRNRNKFVAFHFDGTDLVRQHPLKDAVWEASERSGPQPEDLHVPTLHISGWFDHETQVSMALAQAIRERRGEGARGRQWLLVGPWTHGGTATGQLQEGQLTYPTAEQEATREAKAFFDRCPKFRGAGRVWALLGRFCGGGSLQRLGF